MAIVLDVPSTLPGLFASGARAAFDAVCNSAAFHFTFTPTAASSSYIGGNYHALVGGQPHGNLWLNDAVLEFWDTSDNLLRSVTLSWSAGQTIDVTVNVTTHTLTIAGATTGNGSYSFAAGTYFDTTQGLGVGRDYGSSAYPFAGSISDVDDTNTGISGAGTPVVGAVTTAGTGTLPIAGASSAAVPAITSAGAGHVALAGAGAPAIPAIGSAASGSVGIAGTGSPAVPAVTSAGSGTIGGGGLGGTGSPAVGDVSGAGVGVLVIGVTGSPTVPAVTSAGTGAVAIGGTGSPAVAAPTSAASGALALTGAGTPTVPAVVATGSGSSSTWGPGVSASAIATFGHAAATENCPGGYLPAGGGGADMDGRTPAAVTSQVSGSSFYATRGRPAAVTTDIYDNKSNTWTKLHEGNYGPFVPAYASWDAESWVCLDGTGGSNHVVSTACVVADESHLAWEEIKGGHYLAASSHVQRLTAGTNQTSGAISTTAPAWVYVDWFGVYGIYGAEGFNWTVNAVGESTDPATGWQVADSRIKHHTDGWFQWKRWRRYYAAPTSNIQLTIDTATLDPDQPAQFFAAAFQEAEGRLGAGSPTVGAVTSSGTGTLTHAGQAAITVAPITSAGSGAVALAGGGSPSIAAPTSTAAGHVAIAGAGTPSVAAVSASGAGTLPLAGAGGGAIDAPTVAGTGALPLAATGAATVPGIDSAASGALAVAGTGSPAVGNITASGAGTSESGALGTGSPAVGAVTAQGTGALPLAGAGGGAIADVAAAGAGALPIVGTGAAAAGSVTSSASGVGGVTILPRTFTVSVSQPGATTFTVTVAPAAFTVEVDP